MSPLCSIHMSCSVMTCTTRCGHHLRQTRTDSSFVGSDSPHKRCRRRESCHRRHRLMVIPWGVMALDPNRKQRPPAEPAPAEAQVQRACHVHWWVTLLSYYNVVNHFQNTHHRQHMAHPWRRGMGCLSWVLRMIWVWYVQHHVLFDLPGETWVSTVFWMINFLRLQTLIYVIQLLLWYNNIICWMVLIWRPTIKALDSLKSEQWNENVITLTNL